MAVNVFEGARRISLLLGALWVLGWIGGGLFGGPSQTVYYRVLWPGQMPQLISQAECDNEDGREYLWSHASPEGDTFNVVLCFLSVRWQDGTRGIPYKPQPDGTVFANAKYSPEVTAYQKAVAARFSYPPDTLAEARAAKRAAQIEHWKMAAQFLFGGLLVGWLFVAAVGWIVRGFAGIPWGRDFKT